MINYSTVEIDESGQPNIIIKLMVQLKSFINKVDLPYDIKSQIRISNCLFARFNEKEENKFVADVFMETLKGVDLLESL
ncbi:hypothetical protein KPL40_17265 [Clostridium gasigenes]|uniref:hypothetical protein n=1 Tax=Clostridium gasigenes TaxID=94869 RepID=UPI001C0DB82E|nr:hypothetical protein [Clostridium gasigenes]MBU3134179.1 hypothetical protein [Clostridium gasigenes]